MRKAFGPAYDRGVETSWSWRPLPTQAILCLYVSMKSMPKVYKVKYLSSQLCPAACTPNWSPISLFPARILGKPKAVPVRNTEYRDIIFLCYCLASIEWKLHLTRKTGGPGTSLVSAATWLLMQIIGLLWAFTRQSESSTSHCLYFCNFALAPTTPNPVWVWTVQLWLWVTAIFSHIPVY